MLRQFANVIRKPNSFYCLTRMTSSNSKEGKLAAKIAIVTASTDG